MIIIEVMREMMALSLPSITCHTIRLPTCRCCSSHLNNQIGSIPIGAFCGQVLFCRYLGEENHNPLDHK